MNDQQSPLSVQALMTACRGELMQMSVRPPFYLLAMSLGAMVATAWACTAPAEIAGCVLINTSFRPFSPFYRRLRPQNYLPLLRLILFANSPDTIEKTVLGLTSNRPEQHASVVPEWVATRARRPVSLASAVRQLAAAACYTAPTQAPIANILILASQQDHLVDSRCSRAVAHAWNCRLAIHSFAGHDLALDDPMWVVEQVQHWLDDGTGGPSESMTGEPTRIENRLA